MRINIACGNRKFVDHINIDISPLVKPDMIGDIEKGLPFIKDNSCEEIKLYRILEHIDPGKMRFVLNEIHRIAQNGCILDIIVPFDSIGGRAMIDHKRGFSWETFWPLEQPINQDTPAIKLRLKRVSKIPNKLIRVFYHLFPALHPGELHLIYTVVK